MVDEKILRTLIGTMVWCHSCKTVVWAYDSDWGDMRGVLNMLRIPCRLCGEIGNFNGYNVSISHMKAYNTFDGWSTMKALAEYEKMEWNPSPDNTWRSDEEIKKARSAVKF